MARKAQAPLSNDAAQDAAMALVLAAKVRQTSSRTALAKTCMDKGMSPQAFRAGMSLLAEHVPSSS